jgi:hypothetical protein
MAVGVGFCFGGGFGEDEGRHCLIEPSAFVSKIEKERKGEECKP